jgi:PASTA domain
MPNLVGQNLQEAQDAIQKLTDNPLFLTLSTDATGQGRAQVVDSNWKICSQNVKPGDRFTKDTKIEFASVKLAERCP